MSTNYAMYRWHDGRRLSVGNVNSTSINYTKGPAQFTGAEFHHILRYIKDVLGFHVYANSHFGGVHRTAHGANSWHYVRDAQGRSLGADVGTHGDVNERNRIIRDLIPVLDRLGVAWVYARNGHMPNHHDHIHIDVGIYGNMGGSVGSHYGFFQTRRKVGNVYTALPLASNVKKRAPKSILAGVGARGPLTEAIQGAAGLKKSQRDGIYGQQTANAVKALQRKLKVGVDGTWGPATARAYFATVGNRRKGSTGWTVRMIQYIAGVGVDGIFGNQTENAVKEMQAWAGIFVDGIFGANSRNKLFR